MRTYKIVSLIALTLASLMYAGIAFGDAGHERSVEEILAEIREKHNLGPDDRIDPDRVSDGDLEELGEAVMELMHPDAREHELMDEMMGGFSPFYFGRIAMWILLVAIIAVVVWLVVRSNRQGKSASVSQGFSPFDIVKQRYARGEISRDEYETLKHDLQ